MLFAWFARSRFACNPIGEWKRRQICAYILRLRVRLFAMRILCVFSLLCLLWLPSWVPAQSMPPIVPPRLISMPAPDCSAGTACHRTHGQVRLIVEVLEDGKVGDVRVELGKATLAAAAAEAVSQAEFAPGRFYGKPQSMSIVLNQRF